VPDTHCIGKYAIGPLKQHMIWRVTTWGIGDQGFSSESSDDQCDHKMITRVPACCDPHTAFERGWLHTEVWKMSDYLSL